MGTAGRRHGTGGARVRALVPAVTTDDLLKLLDLDGADAPPAGAADPPLTPADVPPAGPVGPTALALDSRYVWIAAGDHEVIRVDR